MGRLPLAAWLALLTIGVVLLVVGALAPTTLGLFGRLADENARSRVSLAAHSAADGVEREADAVATVAQLLAERPTLQRLTREGQIEEIEGFLASFCRTAGFDGCAVFRNSEVVAAMPREIPWVDLRRLATPGGSFQSRLVGEGAPMVTGLAPLAGSGPTEAMVARRLDASVESRLTRLVGVPVRILVASEAAIGMTELAGESYRSRAPVGTTGDLWIEALLPASEAMRALQPLRRSFAVGVVAASLLAVVAGVLAGRRLSRPLQHLRRAAGRIGSGDLSTPVTPVSGGETAALAASMEEMRQRLRSLATELRRREAEAQALLSGIVEGVFAVDEERRIQYLNPQAAALLGVAAEEVVGRFCGEVLRPMADLGGRPCEDRCPIVHARSRGSSRAAEHLQLAGGKRTVVITSAPPAGPHQVQLIRDETEIETARRSRDAVLANVSHELKTPLSAQLASIELLREGLGSLAPEEEAELVDSLERSSLRLTRLIDNLLESVRIETGQAKLRRAPVELGLLVEEAITLMGPLLQQSRQRVEIEPFENLPLVSGDPQQLMQVLVNLLANAQKYAPAGSIIRVGGEPTQSAVTLWVEDAGPGVPPTLSASIFDRFLRAAPEGEGMGLGLWIAKSIVERHGGRIAVSPSPLGGARFTLTLPQAEVA